MEFIAKLPGAYVVQHLKTGRLLIGATSDLYKNQQRQKSALKHNRHSNPALQALYNDAPGVRFHARITESVEDAYNEAQHLLEAYQGTTVLLNVGEDVRRVNLGRKHTRTTKEKMRDAKTGKHLSKAHRAKISAGRRKR